ncbi:hypothetical protein [Celeribacter halophilus]|uniref:hypothetical protein n=1 Tax=Celeribacter halophilus TaxID=576117 RepID=UPI0026E44590|nr:hypothetical protein [Celeribacter halophilus]
MGFKPTLVQSYFTRPDRLVNPARIQEIKNNSTSRYEKIAEATEEEVGYFVDDFTRSLSVTEDYAPPIQEAEVTQFRLNTNGKVTILSSEADVQFGTPEIQEIYEELREKSLSLNQHGHNILGQVYADIVRFTDALPENPLEASVVRIFMRGSNIKSKLSSFKISRENPELYPLVDLDAAVAPLIEDLVESFTLLVSLTPAMASLEAKASTQENYVSQGEALEAIQPALEEVEQVADPEAAELLSEQLDEGLDASSDQSGRAQRSVAFSSVRNFAISIFTPVFHAARYILGDSKLPSLLKSLRNGAAFAAGKKLYSNLHDRFPAIVEYISNHVESLTTYADKIITNPQLQEFIRSMIEVMSNIQ